jgi:hypothetical protein
MYGSNHFLLLLNPRSYVIALLAGIPRSSFQSSDIVPDDISCHKIAERLEDIQYPSLVTEVRPEVLWQWRSYIQNSMVSPFNYI